jgi:peroxiredoxin
MAEGPERPEHHLPSDGNGEFTRAMGMLVDKSNLGFGSRSWRYSMLVKDGVVAKMFVEPEKEGDPVRGLGRGHDARASRSGPCAPRSPR